MFAGLLPLVALAAGQGPATCPKEVVEPEREFFGLFVDAFEGQNFHDGIGSLSEIRGKHGTGSWMSFDLVAVGASFGITRRVPAYACQIRFKGVRRSRSPNRFPCGYGHMNASASEIMLTHLLAIQPLGCDVSSGNRR